MLLEVLTVNLKAKKSLTLPLRKQNKTKILIKISKYPMSAAFLIKNSFASNYY